DRERALVGLLLLRVLALVLIHEGQVVEGLGHVGVAGAQRLLPDRERALVKPLRLRVFGLCPKHDAQFVERNSVVGMFGSKACLSQPLKLLCIDLGGRVISARVMILKGLVDRLDGGWLGRCGPDGSEPRECKERAKSDRLAVWSPYNDPTP